MARYILVFLLIPLCWQPLHAQELASRRAQADRLFDRAEYFKSVDIYTDLANESNAVDLVERVADCYRLMNNYDQAELWYSRLAKAAGIRPEDLLYYAEALQRNKKLDIAKDQYKRYYAMKGTKEELAVKLAACDSAALWMKREGNYKVANEKKMNSAYADWGVSYLGKTDLLFTSDRYTNDRNHTKEIYNRTGNEWLKIFDYNLKSSSATELVFERGGSINLSNDYHTGPMVTNAAGDTAYITVTTRAGKGSLAGVNTPYDKKLYIRRLELMMAVKKQGKWGQLTRFPYDDVAKYSVGHAALSKNGRVIYFTSDMPGGYGRTDIWYCEKNAAGKWGKPVNCGKTINTADDEAFPSVGGDDKLYYASRGLPGMGGFDIFSAQGAASTWSDPVNMKYPVNSTSDDFSFVTVDGLSGYLSSDRQGGQGSDDIYSFVYTGKDDQLQRSQQNMAGLAAPLIPPPSGNTGVMLPVNGAVYSHSGGQSLDSVTVLLKNADGSTIDGTMVLMNKNFFFSVPSGQDYVIEARKQGYYPVSQRVSAKELSSAATLTNLKLMMEPLEIGKVFIIRTIYYDLNRAAIRPDAAAELDKLVAIMRENPKLKIELSSHTDSQGSDYYNLLLSQARATSAVAYMKRHGIAADRMVAKGYGETRLLNKCANGVPCTEAEHQFNRRTEFKVIGGPAKPETAKQ